MISEINEIAKNIKFVDLPELLHKKLWEYKAEGRANIVVAYRGKNVKYNGVVLRLRKITLEEYKNQQLKHHIVTVGSKEDKEKKNNEDTLQTNVEHNNNNCNKICDDGDNDDDDVIVEDIDNNIRSYNAIDKLQIYNLLYNNLIINNLLGERFSGMNILLKVNPTFLENLNRYIYPCRPENRRSIDCIDNEQFYGTLSLDYTKVKRTQTVIPASIITTSLDLDALNVFDNEPLNNIENVLPNTLDSENILSEKEFKNKSEKTNSKVDIINPPISNNIQNKPTVIDRHSSTISVQVASIPGLESKVLFAEPIENTESESESNSLTNSSSMEALNPNLPSALKKSCSDDDIIPQYMEELSNEIIILNPKDQEKINNHKNQIQSNDSIDKKKLLKKANQSSTFILRPIEDHPLLSEKQISQIELNKLIQQQCQDITSSPNLNSPSNNGTSVNHNSKFSVVIKDQSMTSINDINNQYEIAIPEAQTIAIELKPKWGFKPNPKTSNFIKDKSLIKYKYCRFCLHYLFKNKDKIKETNSSTITDEIHPLLSKHFCPLDLYSGDDDRVSKAINSLYNCPGNNLKLFINGKQVNLKSLNKKDKKKEQGEEKTQNIENNELKHDNSNSDLREDKKSKKEKEKINDNEVMEILTEFFSCNKENFKSVFCDFFTHLILQESELFNRLKFHQRHLDSLDIEKIIKFYESLLQKDYKLDKNSLNDKKEMKEPAVEDWFIGFKNYKNKIKSLPLATKYTNFKPSEINSSNNDINQEIPIKKLEDYTDEEKIQYILEFLISKTLKDCSILIAVQSVNNDNNGENGSLSFNQPILMTQSSSSNPASRKAFVNSRLNKKLKSKKSDSYITNQTISNFVSDASTFIASNVIPSNESTENIELSSNLNFDKDKENYREMIINNKKYRYNIHVVDLDSKSIKKIPNYYKLDQDIVECYHDYKKSFGDCRENDCID